MRVVLDACVPRRFKDSLEGHAVITVGELLGASDLDDGPLFVQLRERCDAFVTTDRSIPFQQSLADLPFAVVVLRARSNRLEHLLPLAPFLLAGIPSQILESLGIERRKAMRFRQACGTVLTRWTGSAWIYAGGTLASDDVVFGEPGDLVLLGSRSLEGLNLRIDPVTKTLVDAGPTPAAVAAA